MKYQKQILTIAAAIGTAFSLTAQTLAPVNAGQANKADAPAEAKTEANAEAKAVKEEVKEAKTDVKADAKTETGSIPADTAKQDPSVAMMDQSIEDEEKKAKESKPVVYKASKLIPYVLLTANYEIPRVFAETARKQLNVPYIIILDNSKAPAADAKAVFFPPKAEKPVMIQAKDISKLLAYLRARDVVILGNTDCVPAFYAKAVPAGSRKIMVNSADWRLNAIKLSNILGSNKITKSLEQYRERRAAELEQKRIAYEEAQQRKAEAIRDAEKSEQELVEAEAY